MKKARVFMKRALILLMLLLVLNNFMITSIAFATSNTMTGRTGNTNVNKTVGGWGDAIFEGIANFFLTIAGLLLTPFKYLAFAVADLGGSLLYALSNIEGKVETSSTKITGGGAVSPFDILFNKIKLVDINFFEFNGIDEASILYKIRISVASWYYIFRILAVAILLVVLIYVGIRMAISTIASDRARYNKYLVDWVASLAIVFLMHYIIVFVLEMNNALISGFAKMGSGSGSSLIPNFNNIYDDLRSNALNWDLYSWAYVIIYCILVGQTFLLFFSYIERMLKIAFLIMISPLITLTYSIDKMGDGKAQAFDKWTKEFIFTVLQQPFQCIIYMSMVGTAFSVMEKTAGDSELGMLPEGIVAIACLLFVKKAEELLRDIFNFKTINNAGSMAAGLAATGLFLGAAKKAPGAVKGAISGVQNFKAAGGIKGAFTNSAAQFKALGQTISGKGDGKSFSQLVEANKDSMAEQQAKRYASKAHVDVNSGKFKAEYDDNYRKYKDMGFSDARARARATNDVVKAHDQRLRGRARRTVSNASGRVKSVAHAFNSLDAIKDLKKMGALTAGVAMGGMFAGASNQKIFTSIAAGYAVSSGLNAAFDANRGDAEQLESIASSLDLTASEADALVKEVGTNDVDYEQGSELEKRVLSDVEKLLQENGDTKASQHSKSLMEAYRRDSQAGKNTRETYSNWLQKNVSQSDPLYAKLSELGDPANGPNAITGEDSGSMRGLTGRQAMKTVINKEVQSGKTLDTIAKQVSSSTALASASNKHNVEAQKELAADGKNQFDDATETAGHKKDLEEELEKKKGELNKEEGSIEASIKAQREKLRTTTDEEIRKETTQAIAILEQQKQEVKQEIAELKSAMRSAERRMGKLNAETYEGMGGVAHDMCDDGEGGKNYAVYNKLALDVEKAIASEGRERDRIVDAINEAQRKGNTEQAKKAAEYLERKIDAHNASRVSPDGGKTPALHGDRPEWSKEILGRLEL